MCFRVGVGIRRSLGCWARLGFRKRCRRSTDWGVGMGGRAGVGLGVEKDVFSCWCGD
jgi:hypothetical protein